MLASVATFSIDGLDARPITVEVDIRAGLPVFTVVGLPDAAVREARERVRAGLLNSGLEFPLKRLTANLAPADCRKAGPGFDLALAVAVLAASGQVPSAELERTAVYGELSLGGRLRPLRGALAIALAAREAGVARLVVPSENASEARLVEGVHVVGAVTLGGLVDLLHGRWVPEAPEPLLPTAPAVGDLPDLAEVRGQADARRALEIAAAGGHNLLMVGPPGAGKTMLARRLPGILPPPSFDEAVEITRIHSVAGLGDGALATRRPFRAPHHTISASGLVGGGAMPRPGEMTLAHRGVLFLDELAEFSRLALEALRQPLEQGRVVVSRAQRTLEFPAEVALVGACNECPCGRPGDGCTCDPAERARYARRLSGPLLDRIDLVCRLGLPDAAELSATSGGEPSAAVRERVLAARAMQQSRLAGSPAGCNGRMSPRETRAHARVSLSMRSRLLDGARHSVLSGRGYDRVLRIARTIADLDGRAAVRAGDVDEALGYRLTAAPAAA